jgi:hypothetical protein
VNLSSIDTPSIFNVSIFVTTTGGDSRTIEKHLIVNIKDKKDFNLTLSNNKVRSTKQIHFLFKFSFFLIFRSWKILMKMLQWET